jgi:acetyl-CoA synthetase
LNYLPEDFNVPIDESKVYTPLPESCENAMIKDYSATYREFLQDPDGYWENIARELEWFREWDRVREWEYPFAKWFVNAKMNITHNCLDRHVNDSRRNKVALLWRGEDGSERIYTYDQLYKAVMKFANGLKKLGVAKGDVVCLYMPVVPEQIISMLACARIGALHSVVFAGFGSAALNQRINGAGAKIVITADMTMRRGKSIPLKPIVEEALIDAPSVDHVIVLQTKEPPVDLVSDIEVDFYELMEGVDSFCPPEIMDSEDPLFILYTSGTTGAPKGIIHTCGGYMVGTYYTTRCVFNVQDKDIYWCTADPGWITGHSYVVYGPLLAGATVFITEHTPDYPDPGIWWKLIQDYGINILYTAPTAIRMFMKVGKEWPEKYDLSCLRILGSVGEPLNPEAFDWFYEYVGRNKCPLVDTWWQTETGMQMITTLIGEPMKPGYAGKAIPGVVVDVVDKNGNSVEAGTGGLLVIKEPWPSMMRMVHENEERYRKYWNTINSYYTAGDLAVKDHDGYIMLLGRSDDLILVAGHNIGTAEVESALVSHKAVAEAAAIGKPEAVKGNIIKAFVILIEGYNPDERLTQELKYHVRQTLGPIAVPSELEYVTSLPKTRSGKIMRRLLKAQEMGIDPGDISTLEE